MKKITPPNLYKLFIVLMLGTLLLPIKRQISFPYNLFGALPFLFGVFMALKSKRFFKQTRTPMHPFANPTQLHQNGFFKYTRNPMYLGIAIGLTGIGILTGFFFNTVFGIIYIALCNILYVKFEEAKLEKEFGLQFKEYKLKTKRWL